LSFGYSKPEKLWIDTELFPLSTEEVGEDEEEADDMFTEIAVSIICICV
jgi:hypothetical protein